MSLLLLALHAAAQAPNCRNPVTQADMTQCAAMEFDRADRELNQVWRSALAAVRQGDRDSAPYTDGRPSGEAVLLAAQRSWLSFRDQHCTLEGYAMRGGTAEPMVYDGCRARLTEERARQLRDIAELAHQ